MKKATLLLLLTTAVGCTVIPDADSSSTSKISVSSSSEIHIPSTSEIVFEVAENNFVRYLYPAHKIDTNNPFNGLFRESRFSTFSLRLDKSETEYICNSLQVADLVLIPREEIDNPENFYNVYITFEVFYPYKDRTGYITVSLYITDAGTLLFSNYANESYRSEDGVLDYQFYMDYINARR